MCACGGAAFDRCSCEGSPDSAFTLADDMGCSVLEGLADAVDQARDVATAIGARPYSVWLVWTRWSDGKRGRGVEETIRERVVLPTPLLTAKSDILSLLTSHGTSEQGFVRASEISVVRYQEDELRGLKPGGEKPDPAEQFYWEVRYPQRNAPAIVKRFSVRGVPEKDMENIQWVIDLTRSNEDRTRATRTPQG